MNSNLNFWDFHGYGFILCMFFFPRLTMLFATIHGGWLWWTGWFFVPRLTVAIIATMHFWNENPFLCVLTWLWAMGLEVGEKSTGSSSNKRRRQRRQR